MTDEYRRYEEACKRIREENAKLLLDFGDWLRGKRLSEKTIRQHVANIDLYVNEFLLYEDAVEAREGSAEAGMFLGYWFIKKATWASETSIRGNAASLKKFYEFMHERGLVSEKALKDMLEHIKEELPEWVATVKRYDDPSITDPDDIWGL